MFKFFFSCIFIFWEYNILMNVNKKKKLLPHDIFRVIYCMLFLKDFLNNFLGLDMRNDRTAVKVSLWYSNYHSNNVFEFLHHRVHCVDTKSEWRTALGKPHDCCTAPLEFCCANYSRTGSSAPSHTSSWTRWCTQKYISKLTVCT